MKVFALPLSGLACAAALALGSTVLCASEPLLELDARDPSAGTEAWNSRVGDAQFKKLGDPRRVPVKGAEAVVFGGHDAYVGPLAPDALTGSSPRCLPRRAPCVRLASTAGWCRKRRDACCLAHRTGCQVHWRSGGRCRVRVVRG